MPTASSRRCLLCEPLREVHAKRGVRRRDLNRSSQRRLRFVGPPDLKQHETVDAVRLRTLGILLDGRAIVIERLGRAAGLARRVALLHALL